MRVRKIKGATQIGDLTVDKPDVPAVRETAVDVITTEWSSSDDVIAYNPPVVALPSGDVDVYCILSYYDNEVEVPDRSFVLKLLQLL